MRLICRKAPGSANPFLSNAGRMLNAHTKKRSVVMTTVLVFFVPEGESLTRLFALRIENPYSCARKLPAVYCGITAVVHPLVSSILAPGSTRARAGPREDSTYFNRKCFVVDDNVLLRGSVGFLCALKGAVYSWEVTNFIVYLWGNVYL